MISFNWPESVLGILKEDVKDAGDLKVVFSAYNKDLSNQWENMDVFYSPERSEFLWLTGTGCECCDLITDDITSLDDFNHGSGSDLKKAIRSFHVAHPESLSEAEMQLAFAKVKKVKW